MPKLTFLGLKDLNPPQQALVCAMLIGIFALGCIVLGLHSMQAWNFLTAPVILFTIMNPIMGIFSEKNRWAYIGWSVRCFIGLALFSYAAGSLVSTFKFSQSRELILFAFLIFIFYFMIYSLTFIFKGVLGFLEDLDK